MADVNETLPESVIKEMERVVVNHALQLVVLYKLLGASERVGNENGLAVSKFMKKWVGEFMSFGLAERTFILKFMIETEEAVNRTLSEVGFYKNEFPEIQDKLNKLMRQAENMANLVTSSEEKEEE
jgi:hypothetical protein